MPKTLYEMPFFPPGRIKEAPNDAFVTYRALSSTVLSGIGISTRLVDSLDRISILNQKGQFSMVEIDMRMMNNIVTAATNGRLFVRDRNNFLRQISLKDDGMGDGGLDFHISEPITKPEVPPRPSFYFIKNLLGKFIPYFNAMVEPYNNWKNFDEAVTNYFDDYNKDKRPNDPQRIKFAPVKSEPLVPEPQPEVNEVAVNEVAVNEVAGNEPEVQVVEVEKTLEEILATNPTKQTTKEFERYLVALNDRANNKPVDAVIKNNEANIDDFYEAVAQEMEGSIARDIRTLADSKSPEMRNAFLEQQKPVMASLSKGLREFVRENADKELVENFFAARADNTVDFMMELRLRSEAETVSSNVWDYVKSVQKQNEANRQVQQPQSSQVQLNQPDVQVQQVQPQPAPQIMSGPPQ